MNWEQLLSLQRFGHHETYSKEQDEIRLGFEVDYDRIVFLFSVHQDKTQVIPFSKPTLSIPVTHSLEARLLRVA